MQVRIKDIALYYKVEGSGPPLLLLHGNGEDHSIFNELAEELVRDFRVYAIDSRNHGQSSKTEDYSYTTMADDLHAFIDTLSLAPTKVVGFSDGAIIALLCAMDHPEDISKMALLGVNLKPDDFTEESYRFVKETYEETKDPLFKLMLEQPDIELSTLSTVEVPTLVVAGEHDIFKPQLYTDIVRTLPHARLKIMDGHDHDSYISHTDMLYGDLHSFLT